jgi:hypothetical protein
MWKCSSCERLFKTANQSHSCAEQDLGVFFENRPDSLVMAFDSLMTSVLTWEPNSVGASKNAIIFTNKKAWLIIRPMTKELDVKFYYDESLDGDIFKKITFFGGKYAHHIRIKEEEEITAEVLYFLKKGFDFALR